MMNFNYCSYEHIFVAKQAEKSEIIAEILKRQIIFAFLKIFTLTVTNAFLKLLFVIVLTY